MKSLKILFTLIAFAFAAAAASAQTNIRIAGWNMESGESDNTFLKAQIADKDGIDLWGFSEVQNGEALTAFEEGAEEGEEADFQSILGTTGSSDRLGIVFNAERLELLGTFQLTRLQGGNPSHRASLVAHFRGRETGQEFLFMVNHLARGNQGLRLRQAQMLNRWALDEAQANGRPVIAVGDYNMDLEVNGGLNDPSLRDPSYDAMITDGVWRHLHPENAVKTQASDRFSSILDFVFVSNPPEDWTGVSRILNRDGDDVATEFDFDEGTDAQETDHRPVDAILTLDAGDPVVSNAGEPMLVPNEEVVPQNAPLREEPDARDSRSELELLRDALEAFDARIRALDEESAALRKLVDRLGER